MTSYRMAGQDCAMARIYENTTMAIQIAWLYDRPVDMDELAAFHGRLQRGRLGRVAAPALRYLGAAGDRWTSRAEFAPLAVEPSPIERCRVNEWVSERADEDLVSYGGPGWRLAVAEVDDGGAVVSLVVSHVLVDALAMCQAVAEAVTDTGPNWSFASDRYGRFRLAVVDAGAAIRQLVRAAAGHLTLLVESWVQAVTGKQQETAWPARAEVPDGGFELAPIVRLTVRVDAEQWREASAARGGTPTTLCAAMMADLAVAFGRVDVEGQVGLILPVSMRTDSDDERANMQSSAYIVIADDNRTEDLKPLRAQMKKGFQRSPAQYRAYRLGWPMVGVFPRPRAQYSRRTPPPPDLVATVCSVAGEVDPMVSRIDGDRAASVAVGLVWHHDRDLEASTAAGGMLRGLMTTVDGELAVRLTALHPSVPLSVDELRSAVTKVLGGYGLTPTFW